MTPDDLAAIKARHQPATHYTGRQYCALDNLWWPCDTRRLLDDRKEQDRVAAVAFLAGADDERARIAEAVKGLNPKPCDDPEGCGDDCFHLVTVPAVLAIIGEADDER